MCAARGTPGASDGARAAHRRASVRGESRRHAATHGKIPGASVESGISCSRPRARARCSASKALLATASYIQYTHCSPQPPAGASEVLGLEAAGIVSGVGEACTRGFSQGDRVMALLSGGGYATKCVVDERLVMRIPETMSFETAAAIPEAWLTAYQLLSARVANLQRGEDVLVHAAASSVVRDLPHSSGVIYHSPTHPSLCPCSTTVAPPPILTSRRLLHHAGPRCHSAGKGDGSCERVCHSWKEEMSDDPHGRGGRGV